MALSKIQSGLLDTNSVDATALSSSAITSGDLPAGNIVQLVQNTTTSQYNITTGGNSAFTAWTQLTDYNVTITPSSTSSKIYLMATIPWFGMANSSGTAECQAIWYRNTTQLNGGQPMAAAYMANNTYIVATCQWLDSPSTTSAITYRLYGRGRYSTLGEYAYNRGSNGVVVLTAMEILA